VLFDRANIIALEEGQPKNKFSANLNWKLGQWGATARVTRYGKTMTPGTTAAFDFPLAAQTVVDLEARLALTRKLSLALGADNVFDRYPETLPPALNTTGNTPFSNYSPFGRSGRFVYMRANYGF